MLIRTSHNAQGASLYRGNTFVAVSSSPAASHPLPVAANAATVRTASNTGQAASTGMIPVHERHWRIVGGWRHKTLVFQLQSANDCRLGSSLGLQWRIVTWRERQHATAWALASQGAGGRSVVRGQWRQGVHSLRW